MASSNGDDRRARAAGAGAGDGARDEREGLFVYGTLRFPEVLAVLLGRVPRLEPARAPGWRVRALSGVVYPGLVPDPACTADGTLILGLSEAEQRLLDAFEGDLYERRRLALEDGRHGWAYIWRGRTEPRDWDLAGFAERHLAAYVDGCRIWRARHERAMGLGREDHRAVLRGVARGGPDSPGIGAEHERGMEPRA